MRAILVSVSDRRASWYKLEYRCLIARSLTLWRHIRSPLISTRLIDIDDSKDRALSSIHSPSFLHDFALPYSATVTYQPSLTRLSINLKASPRICNHCNPTALRLSLRHSSECLPSIHLRIRTNIQRAAIQGTLIDIHHHNTAKALREANNRRGIPSN